MRGNGAAENRADVVRTLTDESRTASECAKAAEGAAVDRREEGRLEVVIEEGLCFSEFVAAEEVGEVVSAKVVRTPVER